MQSKMGKNMDDTFVTYVAQPKTITNNDGPKMKRDA